MVGPIPYYLNRTGHSLILGEATNILLTEGFPRRVRGVMTFTREANGEGDTAHQLHLQHPQSWTVRLKLWLSAEICFICSTLSVGRGAVRRIGCFSVYLPGWLFFSGWKPPVSDPASLPVPQQTSGRSRCLAERHGQHGSLLRMVCKSVCAVQQGSSLMMSQKKNVINI